MNSIDTLATFFGWCTALNLGLLLLAMLVFSVFRDIFATITAKMFGVTKESGGNLLPRVSAIPIRSGGPEYRSLYRPEDHVLIQACQRHVTPDSFTSIGSTTLPARCASRTRVAGIASRLLVLFPIVLLVGGANSAQGCERYGAPFFRGTGGFVVEPTDSRSAELTVQGSNGTEVRTVFARNDGLAVELLRSSLCTASPGGDPVECGVTLSGIEDGGWYWVNGDRNAAVAPLICEDDLGGGAAPLDPGGVETTRGRFGSGTLFVHETQGLMGIVPQLSQAGGGDPQTGVAP